MSGGINYDLMAEQKESTKKSQRIAELEAKVARLEAEAKENEEQIRNDMRDKRIIKAKVERLEKVETAAKAWLRAWTDGSVEDEYEASNALQAALEDR